MSGGNTVVIKSSSKSAACTAVLKRFFAEVFPPEYVTLIDGGHDVADMCLAQRFDKIFYTGSPAVGKHVLAAAADNLTPVALELGGETGNWCVIRRDADLRDAARKIAFFKLTNAGQICININQIAVAEEVADVFLEELKKEFPERKFYALDTKGITIVSYNIVREIGDMFNAGKTVEEVLAWADREVLHFAQYFFADDLKFFKRSGRVKGIAATMGTLLGIRPIICMNDAGEMINIGKERGRAKAIDRLVRAVEELGDDVKAHRIIIGHTGAPDIAKEIENELRARLGDDLNIETVVTNPTAGSHCGPNGAGVSFHAKRRI